MGFDQNGDTVSYVYLFWWAHPATLQWCASAKGYPCLGEKMLVNTQTSEVRVIFMAIWKMSACSIVYPVVSMQIQKPSQRHLHLKFLARVYSVPDYLAMHVEPRYPYSIERHFCEVLLISIHMLNRAIDEACEEGTHQALWILVAAWAPGPQRRKPDPQSQRHLCMEINLQDEAGWNSSGRIWLNALKFESSSMCFFLLYVLAVCHLLHLFKISLLEELG